MTSSSFIMLPALLRRNGVLGNALRNIGLLSVARAATILLGIAGTIVWARLMPPESFGEFKVVMAIVGFVSTFCLAGAGQAALMAASRNQDGTFTVLVRHKLLANTIGSGALIVAAAYCALARPDSISITLGLISAAALFCLYNTSDLWSSWLNGKGRFGELATGNALVALVALGAILLAATLQIHSLWQTVGLYLGVLAVVNIAMLLRMIYGRTNNDLDRSILRFGQHATVAMMFGSLLSLDLVIFDHFYPPQDVALYAIALQFPDQLKGVLTLAAVVIIPRLYAETSLSARWERLQSYFWVFMCAAALIGVAGFFLLPWLTGWLFGERYVGAAATGKWLWLVVSLTNPITTFFGHALMATKMRTFLYGPYIAYPLILTSLYLALVPMGIHGMILARAIAVSGLATFYLVAFVYLRPKLTDESLNAGAGQHDADASTAPLVTEK